MYERMRLGPTRGGRNYGAAVAFYEYGACSRAAVLSGAANQKMPTLGHKRTLSPTIVVSASPPIADILCGEPHVCFVPIADIAYSQPKIKGRP